MMPDLKTIQDQIDVMVQQKMALTNKPRWDCQAMVMRENPDLRQQLVDAKNQTKR